MAKGEKQYQKRLKIDFTAYCLHVLNEGCTEQLRWYPSRFHKYLCRAVQKFVETPTDKAYEVLLVMTPPQHGKSLTITETLPAWFLGGHPEGKVIVGCYNSEYSRKFGMSNRRLIRDYGFLFGQELSGESKAIEEFKINTGGTFKCRGLLSGITGNGADLFIIDDPVKNAAEAYSKTKRDAIWNEYIMTAKTRLSAGAKIIVIMTPWHEDDLAGRIQATEENLTILKFPCECEDENDVLGRALGDSLMNDVPKDKVKGGSVKDNRWLESFKRSFLVGDASVDGQTGRKAWEAMFQCRPVSEEGNILKREWWKFYEELPPMDRMVMSVDCAFKGSSTSDYVAVQVWGKRYENYYLIDAIKDHLDFPDTVRTIYAVKSRYPKIKEVLIEDKANGPAVMSILQSKVSGLIAVNPFGGKESRVNAVAYLVEGGNVFLPRAGFSYDFIDECASFPHAKHDDQVDAFSQALGRLIQHRVSKKEREQIDRYKYLTYKKHDKKGKITYV